MFEDILEIMSPWILPNWITIEALKSWIYQRFTRNEYIMNFATKILSRVEENLWSWIFICSDDIERLNICLRIVSLGLFILRELTVN